MGEPFPNIKSQHSLVAKYVTKEVWDKLGSHKTATSGFTLGKAIACAVEFDNQHCGIYAGDWDSYKDFAAVFDPIIQEYHGISPDAKHSSDMDVTKIKGNIDVDVPVNSVRIRVGRSIDGFGLSPGITKEQRVGVENLMKSAFKKMPGDLSGNYFPLTGMDEKIRQQLVDDHFLFMSGDPNLKVAGMERDWPEGRGIYHNKDKTFLVWVNEEDQLRIISMEMGGDVRGVFERLARGIKAVGDSVKAESGKEFCLDAKYGYVHSCPTNLGTGMRASVHVDLPGWTKDGVDNLKKRCEELKVQPRGTRGESGGQTGCTYDISNKHRLGYSEVELVQCMIDGVNTLYKEDIELQKKHGIFPYFPEIKSKHSLVAKHVTEAKWKKLAGLKTATSGFTMARACACAIMFDNQHCGIYAGDWDSYRDFADVFDPIIQEYHGISADAKHTSDMDVGKIQGNIDSTVPVNSVRIRVGRSIDGFGLSPGITREQRVGVENLMKSAFKKLPGDLSGNYYPLLGMEENVRQQLVDDHFLFVSGDPNLKVAGMERDWPEGRGIYHNAAKTFLVWVNEEDQLRIISMQMGGDVKGVFERLARGIKAVGDSVKAESGKDFCLDPKYGYVHSCPTNLGTGMRASVHVDLPGWTAEGLNALKQRCEELKVQPRGTRGESGGQTGCTYDISNKHRLGYSEVELVQCMIDGVNTLYREDMELQKKHKLNEAPPFPNIKSKHSLVAKHVTPEVWAKIGGIKTKTSGFTLSKAIACAVEFDNQHCGIYAGDWDSYRDFSAVFDPIIQEYHGISPNDKHTSNMDVTMIKGNINEGIPVHSVRIRVGRSIDGFGLSPGITKEQRIGVENLMKSAFQKLPGDLSGKYYPLTGMDEKIRQQLVDDHFLFMSGDANLKVAGMERDWPEGRGIYHNAAKSFLVWVNEEDQLRIISMEMGGDVKGVFERLARGIQAVGDSVKAESGKVFCLDPKYGYVHSCPTNLGTGMRASVHVDLPGWTKEGVDALKKRCEDLKVQPRGTRGESGGQTGCTYDISNKHRLGYSEVELVQCMIDGVNTLYAEDLELQKKHGMFPYFPEIKSKHSLVAKHVTEERYKKLGAHKTATSGFTLQKAIACATMFDNQHCGIYAGDWDSYRDFAEIFDPLIQEYHGISADARHTSDMDVTKIKGNINSDAPVHSVRIRVGRSIDGFGLSPGITRQQRLGVENLMKNAFKKLPGDLSGSYYPLLGMDEKVRQQLVDDHFLFVSGDANLKVAGMERDWPEGRGIFHNSTKTFLIWVNEEDQLRIISMEMGGDVFGVFERLARGIKAVGESVMSESGKGFMLDPKYGYVHSCPTNLGTGMRASVHVDLAGWTAEGLPALKKRCEELKVQPRGTRGESGGQTGCTYDISNKHRLGYSEIELVQCMIDGVNTLFQEDIALQQKHGIFPYFPEIKSKHSLVAKHVTPQVWKKLAAHSTATSGFTLRKACACALLFDNQHCGIYAGDWDSYKDFAAVFDPIIQEYHGIKPGAIHTSDMDVSKIRGNIDSTVPVHSVRIRVGRSIDGFGLSPGITREQRMGVESLMKSAFQKLSGDLSGNYFPLLGMDERVRQQLVDDHFLFVSGDPNLKVAGMERDWPEGRGIYHNAEKTFLVWVNEEDQLRIISMQKGGDVKGVFERLARGIKAVGDSVKSESGKEFALDAKYGYVHSCPTNLGTGMRASVHVDLPGWTAKGLKALQARCEELKVQPRGTRGESGGQTGCTYDISNKHRLGYSEIELVQCMIDGVNTLYKEDLALQKGGASAPVQASGPAPPFPNIKSKHSLVAKYVTPDIWAKMGGHVTKTAGFTLSKAIACAVEFDNQHCGIYAGDWDSYKDFAAVFDPLIQEYHGIKPGAKHTSDMDVTKIKGNIDMYAPVHSVRIRVGRSIDGFGLSPGITREQRVGVESLMKSAFKKMPGNLSGNYYPLTGMDEKVRQQLVDDHFLFMSGDPNLKVAGMERDWPEGRGIYHNKDKTFLVWVNEEDQLRIISMEMGGDVKGVFERLARGIKAVGESVKAESGKEFCLDSKYGYVHSCPTNLGTGMRASVHVDLPGWTAEGLKALQVRCEELKVQPRGTRGESGGQTGCTYDISNKHRLGYSEVELVQCMIDGVNTLFKEDIQMQQKHGIYPHFPEIKSKHSLVAKHVTEARFKKLGAIKTATSGFTLQKAIACAAMFDNQHCGIYAGDWDSYRDFAEVFDPIIQEYHGISADSKHTSNMDASQIKGNINPAAPVHSVRIRVGRSIDGFGLSPGITREQRLGVENLMKNAFKKLPGDLSGNYYALLGMDEKVRQQLVDDHFLFVSGDPNLKVAGMERDWPEGRGIFHNSTKTFLVWVNEEDQLRIISMEMGGDVFGVFERLARGIKAVGDCVKADSGKDFCLDPKYGYVHSCPTNLGTGMRASVHVDLPGWTAEGLKALQARCEQLKVQPRGTRGESGGQTGCTFDISNKHRLGYSEVELVQCMIDGVNTLHQEDIALQKKHGMYPAMPEIKSAHSLVAKHVTPQIWKQLADHKTATSGFTLRQACACALLFDNQHCGIYAGDWDSYKDFAAVFDPIIQEYHGIKPGAVHTSDMDVNKIQGNIDASVPVNSVRIRVGRSIDGFGLSPGITREQRLGVENLMKSAFKKLSGDLSGNYYPLLGMDEKVRQQLVDDHFLFVSGDPNLKVAGMERDWPEGRGIYHNAAKTFLVWVNEEDQLRIISMQMGGDVRGVFERLACGIKAVGDSVKAESGKDFCLDPKYGYVHSCPTNLGTGMRASVHVDLPGWTAKGLKALQARCEELKVQPRGTRGESGGQTGCTYDISNKHRLGYSEVELVQCMIDGVNTLYKEDLALQKSGGGSAPMQASGPAGPFPNIKSKHSLVAKYVTPDIWAKLGGHVTRTSGFTLTKAIACAIEFDNQHCGIYAGDWDSYKDFAAVFDPLIQEYHGIKPGAKHTSDMDVTKIKGNIDVDVPVHSVRIRVGRSIDGFGLSPGITREQRVGVEKLMKSAFKQMPGDLSGNYYPLTGMDEKVRQQLVDDHFLFVSGDPNLKVAGMERDWPEGRGIYHNKDKTFLVWVNEEDQLRIISMEMGGDVKGVFARLARGIKAVGDSVKSESGKEFALDAKYGYVHSCPTNLGTGMRASVHADLPGWTAEGLKALQARCEELKVQPRGTRGESGGQTGVTYDISNKHRLGYSEVELVQCMIDGVNTLYREDIQLQQKHGIYPFYPEIKSKHSLVAKHVTEARFKKLGAIKTATSGFTLQKAIACAAMFDNQHCGIYAGDWDSYKDFAEVFDPIIQEYHGISSDARHTSNMDASQIKGNIHPDTPVHSVRIRVGRSIDGFGLSPGITRQQRVGVENLMKSAFKKLPGDLSGKYYPLLGMDEKIRQQLVDDHFLFVSGDPNLKVAGMERDWPEGRGIFHNSAKSFLVWVNEEDQLRIISMEMGGDVFGVFERLARGIKAVQDSVKAESGKDFCLDPKYGYIHSCPTNLGTGMRASVHVDLPGWTTEGVNALKARCEQLKVQPRGTRGESGGQTGCTYDISNKHRLGYSEVELVQCMIDGVNTLYQEDIALQKKHGIFPAMPEIKSSHSLVAKHVTPQVWKKLGAHTTATAGFTLRKACACALLFDNQHCGIYAGDWDSYKDFAAVFDPIIQEYHGIKPGDVHTSDMDVNKIKGNIDASVPVNSVRIRVGRSIDGFGLSPGITREQRLGVENLMKSAFKKLAGDLAGNYFPLLGMDEKIRQQLVDDHFLFVSGDPNLKVAGMERDWPEGRGIYHNAAKTFLVWVNEEDQLRIISMEMGGDVRGVFERLARGIKAVGDSVKAESGKDFCLDAKYGYVHSCPTNLGTGMRASVHVDLPGWTAKGLKALQARCEELKVQPRGTRGESGGQTGCTYDISNKHRLGYSEVELVQCMIDGVNTLYKEDLELQKTCPGSAPTPKATMGPTPPFPNIKSKHSLVAKYVTPDIWAKLGGLTTGTSGFTLSKAIACAVEFDNQHCGIYAGDWDSYKEFAAVFDPLIQEYHGISPSARHTSDMDVKKIKGNIIPDVPVHSVRIRVGRSIDGFGLSPGITREQRLGVENLMKSAFTKMPGDLSGKYFPLTGMDEKVRQQLVDDHFLFVSGDPNLKVAGMERDWPEGRGIYHNKDKTFLVWVNEEDQLRIISMEMGGDVKGVFERLARGIKAVGDSVKAESGKEFCLDPKYGYVHSCPTNLGTGMRASVHADLPGWTAEGLKALQARCEELKVQPRGTRGESGGQTGCTYDISNKHRLGYSEVELVQCMIDGVNTLYQEDIALQKKNGITSPKQASSVKGEAKAPVVPAVTKAPVAAKAPLAKSEKPESKDKGAKDKLCGCTIS